MDPEPEPEICCCTTERRVLGAGQTETLTVNCWLWALCSWVLNITDSIEDKFQLSIPDFFSLESVLNCKDIWGKKSWNEQYHFCFYEEMYFENWLQLKKRGILATSMMNFCLVIQHWSALCGNFGNFNQWTTGQAALWTVFPVCNTLLFCFEIGRNLCLNLIKFLFFCCEFYIPKLKNA